MAKKSSKSKGTIVDNTTQDQTADTSGDAAQDAAPDTEETSVDAGAPAEQAVEQPVQEAAAETQEPEPVAVVDTQAAIGQVQEQAVQLENISSSNEFEQKRVAAFESSNAHMQLAVTYLDTYLEDMKPNKPMSDEQGARAQTNFWRFLRQVINNAGENFNEVMTLVVDYFREHGEDTAFGDAYLYRFSHALTMGSDEVRAYFSLLNVIKILANTKDRAAAVRQIDIERTFGQNYSDQGREAMVNFITGNV